MKTVVSTNGRIVLPVELRRQEDIVSPSLRGKLGFLVAVWAIQPVVEGRREVVAVMGESWNSLTEELGALARLVA